MKKYFLVFLASFQLASALGNDGQPPERLFDHNYSYFEDFDDDCDACGCAANSGLMGFNSLINPNFIGLRYINQSYNSTDGLYTNSAWYKEKYNTLQLWARIPIVENVQIAATVPYHSHNRGTATGDQEIKGLGDITVLGMYNIYKTTKDSTVFVHNVQVGAGVKLPTGEYNQSIAGTQNPSFQLGTGSWDYLLASEYVVRKDKLGLSSMVSYVIKTENQKEYRYGNQLNYGSVFFYSFEKGNYSIIPQAGLSGEIYGSNYQHQQRLDKTSGDVLFGKMGFEAGRDTFSIGANVMLPIAQNLSGGNLDANYRWSINFNYSL